ncbi:unnamed protein product, partial [Didymodactylos carnosus]
VAPQSALNRSNRACPLQNKNSSRPEIHYEFDWSPKTQGLVLGAFYYGYMIPQLLLTLLTPVAARTHVGLLIAIRFIIGFVSGPMFPAAAALWGKWVPPLERSTIPPAAQTGTNFGIIITTSLVSLLSTSKFLGGWPSIFYVVGIFSCLWFIGWSCFAYNSPSVHPRISAKEKTYLLQYSSPSSKNGILFAIPYFGIFLVTIVSGQIVRRIRAKNILTTTNVRKLQTIIGAVGSSIFLITIGFLGCDHIGAVICSILAVVFLGFHNSGCLISHLDVASNYAGTLTGITNSLAAIPGFVAPAVVGAITNNNVREEQEWNRQSEYKTDHEIIQ